MVVRKEKASGGRQGWDCARGTARRPVWLGGEVLRRRGGWRGDRKRMCR